ARLPPAPPRSSARANRARSPWSRRRRPPEVPRARARGTGRGRRGSRARGRRRASAPSRARPRGPRSDGGRAAARHRAGSRGSRAPWPSAARAPRGAPRGSPRAGRRGRSGRRARCPTSRRRGWSDGSRGSPLRPLPGRAPEAQLLGREQAAEVRPVLPEDEESQARRRGGGPIALRLHPAEPLAEEDQKRQGEGRRERAERDVALPGDDRDEQDDGESEGGRREHGHRARRCSDPLAAAQSEEDREDVAEDNGERRSGRERSPGTRRASRGHRGGPLAEIEQEGGDPRLLARGAESVRGPRVAAAQGAQVVPRDPADEQVAERDRAEHVAAGEERRGAERAQAPGSTSGASGASGNRAIASCRAPRTPGESPRWLRKRTTSATSKGSPIGPANAVTNSRAAGCGQGSRQRARVTWGENGRSSG